MDEDKKELPSATNGGVKCPECHAYYVWPGEKCKNCQEGRSRHQVRKARQGK